MEETKAGGSWLELVKFIIITVVIVVPIRVYVAQPFIVSGSSMLPTFIDGDYLIVDELSYHFEAPARNDVIVFHYPKDESKFFIKRIIGLPSETINQATGRPASAGAPGSLTLASDEYFVMGDNRSASSDSRVWGPVKYREIQGRVLIRLLPVSHFSLWPGSLAAN